MSLNSREISDVLERQILFGQLKPRERLVEEEMIAQLDITRHQARQALIELERRGLVVRIANRGAHVRDFSEEEIRQIGAVREMLHSQAAALIPFPTTPELISQLRRHQRRHAEAVENGDLMEVHESNNAFHATLFGACENPYLAQTISDYAAMSLAFRCHLMVIPNFAKRAALEHSQMIDAIVQGRRDDLVALCREHTRPAQAVYRELRGWANTGFAANQVHP